MSDDEVVQSLDADAERLARSRRADQGFIVSQISRKDVAEELNEFIDASEDAPPDFARLEPDDERLTDVVCQQYADGLYEVNEDGDGLDDLRFSVLGGLGYVPVEPVRPDSSGLVEIQVGFRLPDGVSREELIRRLQDLVGPLDIAVTG